MSLRLIEMIIPKDQKEKCAEILEDNEFVLDYWPDTHLDKTDSIKIVLKAEKSQNVIDSLNDNFSHLDDFKLIVQKLEAISPQPEEDEKEEDEDEEKSEEEKKESRSISREELYSTLSSKSELSGDYLLLIGLAAIVASIGVMGDTIADIAVIIGAMVIAPFVGPNMGLSLATTLAEPKLGKESIRTIFLGILTAFLISAVVGAVLLTTPNTEFIMTRLQPGVGDVVLALSAGIAGAISYTRDVATALIGVMVSISLLPTLVTSGLLFGAGFLGMAGSSMVLFLINLTCINLAGVLTFLVEGIKPRTWYQADKAKNMTRWAMFIWLSMLSALIIVIFFFI